MTNRKAIFISFVLGLLAVLLLIVYNVLRHDQSYQEPTPTNLDQHRRRRARDRALDQLRQLGYDVTVTPKPAVA